MKSLYPMGCRYSTLFRNKDLLHIFSAFADHEFIRVESEKRITLFTALFDPENTWHREQW